MSVLQHLLEIDLDGNKNISGPIPLNIGEIPNLTTLDLDDNQFTGNIPISLYTLGDTLRTIDLNNNLLTGIISEDIGNLVNLFILQLDNNDFIGTIPPSIGNAKDLRKCCDWYLVYVVCCFFPYCD